MQPRHSGMCPAEGQHTDRGWIRAGLAVLVAGVLGGGVLAAACGTTPPHKVTADGMTAKPPGIQAAGAETPLDLAGAPKDAAADAPKADPVVGDKVAIGSDGGSVTVSAMEDDVSAGRLFGAGKGFKYIAAEVKGCSGPHEKNLSFEPAYFLLKLDDGTMRDHGAGAKKPELTGGTVPAGKCLSGWVTFTVPEGALPTGVVYDGSSRTTWTVPLPKGAKQTTTTTMRPGTMTTTTEGPTTTSTSKAKATATTTTTRAATTAKAGGTTATTAKPAPGTETPTSATTGKGMPTTSTTKPAGTTSTTAKPTTPTTTGKPTTTTTAAQE
ncbi:MAG: hypothetical protein QOD57_1230 [Actinomycetota bacterium]|nr:hypothetical protein [Actinomycetota bacterium]MDQ1503503.1 hypothetical protein [Actinomycetota bacterium]